MKYKPLTKKQHRLLLTELAIQREEIGALRRAVDRVVNSIEIVAESGALPKRLKPGVKVIVQELHAALAKS
jgi:fructose-1-phosphate kinase PfkB-like protein